MCLRATESIYNGRMTYSENLESVLIGLTAWPHILTLAQRAPGIHLIGGPAGSGKARVAEAVAYSLKAHGVQVADNWGHELRGAGLWEHLASLAHKGISSVQTIHAGSTSVQRIRERLEVLDSAEPDLRFLRSATMVNLVPSQRRTESSETPMLILSEVALFEADDATRPWNPIVTMHQDAMSKMLRGELAYDALDKNLCPVPRPQRMMTFEQALASMDA